MRVTSKGQVTIPQDVRESIGLHPGMEVEFEVDARGVRLVPASPADRRLTARPAQPTGVIAMSTEEIAALTRGHD